MKIVILDCTTIDHGDMDFSIFDSLGEVTVYQETLQESLLRHIGNAEVILCNKTHLPVEVLEQCPFLRYIGLFATGYNNIATRRAAELGITVCNAPDYSTDAVAQFAFALLLELVSRVGEYAESVRRGDWIGSGDFTYYLQPMFELAGKTMGIIGFGSIGKRIAVLARAFKMEVLVYTRTPKASTEEGIHYVTLEELLRQSDAVSIHAPLTDQTRGLLNAERIAWMKPTAYVINTARGPIIDEAALADALKDGRLAGAGLDVLSREPMRADNPLIGVENCIITPHIAWKPTETRRRLFEIVADNLRAYQQGEPKNVVID